MRERGRLLKRERERKRIEREREREREKEREGEREGVRERERGERENDIGFEIGGGNIVIPFPGPLCIMFEGGGGMSCLPINNNATKNLQ